MTKIKRHYNLNLATTLDSILNIPYNHQESPVCEKCSHTGLDSFSLTGYIIDDGMGVYVEKKCNACGVITDDGHGDFHQIYCITGQDVSRIEDV